MADIDTPVDAATVQGSDMESATEAAGPRRAHPPDLERLIEVFESIPHGRDLGMVVVELRAGHALTRMAYENRLVGNPITGVLHGGVVTAFLDTSCGLAVMAGTGNDIPPATLDLRIDYMRPAAPHQDMFASAECYKVTQHVAFVRGLAYQDTFRNPIATCVGAFMVNIAPSDPIPPRSAG